MSYLTHSTLYPIMRDAMDLTPSTTSPVQNTFSMRTIIEGIAVAGIIWLATSVNNQNLAIARLQVQLTEVQATLIDVPSLTKSVAQIEVGGAERDRRITTLEQAFGSIKAHN